MGSLAAFHARAGQASTGREPPAASRPCCQVGSADRHTVCAVDGEGAGKRSGSGAALPSHGGQSLWEVAAVRQATSRPSAFRARCGHQTRRYQMVEKGRGGPLDLDFWAATTAQGRSEALRPRRGGSPLVAHSGRCRDLVREARRCTSAPRRPQRPILISGIGPPFGQKWSNSPCAALSPKETKEERADENDGRRQHAKNRRG